MSEPADQDDAEITALLHRVNEGGEDTEAELLAAVYSQLRRLASGYLRREGPGHTLQTTALVHEAYLKLFRKGIEFQNRSHFFALAARAMRRILVDHARMRVAERRGGRGVKVSLDRIQLISDENIESVLAVDHCLARLAEQYPRHAMVVELHLFTGLAFQDCADILKISARTAKRDWAFAQAWLYTCMFPDNGSNRGNDSE